eukprot:s548_g27.t2
MAAKTEETKLVRLGSVEFLVDGFLFQRKDVSHYVLTHFHSDHTVGLTRNFDCGTIYCTDVTAALITEMMGVDAARVVALPLQQPLQVQGVWLTFVDAGHCPGSAMVVFEEDSSGSSTTQSVVLHTGDCRASAQIRDGLMDWLAGRTVAELFLDTTYCARRWTFPAQQEACSWLAELTAAELQREPKTLFVVGCYQIGKERAAQAVAEAAGSSVFVEQRRWKVIQLAGWGDACLKSGQPLWSIDKEGCCVWMSALGGLAHDVLKHYLDSTKGQFESVVAFSPTGWAWSPKAMAKGSSGCRAWVENDGRTRVYIVPYSEHSSFTELQSFVSAIKPGRLVPTVNSETRESKERMMAPFLDVLDLKGDPERMDHYMFGGSSSSSACKPETVARSDSFVDVLSLSSRVTDSLPAESADDAEDAPRDLTRTAAAPVWRTGVLSGCRLDLWCSARARTASRSLANVSTPGSLHPVVSFYEGKVGQEEWLEVFEAVRWYADAAASNYRKLNRYLRDGPGLLGKQERDLCSQKVKLLDDLGRAAPVVGKPGLTLWRGFSSFSYVQHLQGSGAVAGSQPFLVKDEAYMSCSLLQSVGNFYARRHALLPEDLEDAVLLEIQVPPGARVICVFCSGAGVPNEEEVMLPRGSTIRVERLVPRSSETSVLQVQAVLLVDNTTCETELPQEKRVKPLALTQHCRSSSGPSHMGICTRHLKPGAMDLDSEDSTTVGGSSSSTSPARVQPDRDLGMQEWPSTAAGSDCAEPDRSASGIVELSDSQDEAAAAGEGPEADTEADDLRCVDVEQQKRLLRFFESAGRSKDAKDAKGPQKLAAKKPAKNKGKGKGKGGKGKKEPEAPVLKHLGVKLEKQEKPKAAPRKRTQSGTAKRQKTEPGPNADPKLPGEKRPTRFVPKPSARVQERIDRAFGHRLYFLARSESGSGEKLDVLGSTGNVYHVELQPQGNSCTCLDFAKGGGVCKHLLFVTLRVLKLARDDHRVWQTGFTSSELAPLLEKLRSEEFRAAAAGVQADATIMRGYRKVQGSQDAVLRQPLPADCPICFEQIESEEAAEFCRTCGHNVHADCRRRWAAASGQSSCPMCRSPWGEAASKAAEADAPVNLAAYSAEHREVSLAALYPETHRWIQRREGE